jgi:hypothetical protein
MFSLLLLAETKPDDLPWPTIWAAIEAIATLIAVFGVWAAFMQLKLSTWIKLQEIYTEEKFSDARDTVFHLQSKDYEIWTDKQKKAACIVCRKMDELAHMQRFMCPGEILKHWSQPYAKAWKILKLFVIQQRKNDDWIQKWKAFEELGEEAATIWCQPCQPSTIFRH